MSGSSVLRLALRRMNEATKTAGEGSVGTLDGPTVETKKIYRDVKRLY